MSRERCLMRNLNQKLQDTREGSQGFRQQSLVGPPGLEPGTNGL
jgi:hypothetical protein